MTHLKSLTFTVAPRKASSNPTLVRRERMVARLEEQRQLARDPSFAPVSHKRKRQPDGSFVQIERRRLLKPWWRKDDAGSLILTVRCGLRSIEFEKGKSGIVVGSEKDLDTVLATLVAAVNAGELDTMLQTASRDVRTRVAAKAKKGASKQAGA